MELPVRAGRCPERDQSSHDEPGDHLSQGKRRHRQRSSGIEKDSRSSGSADKKRDRSRAGARRKAGQQSGKKIEESEVPRAFRIDPAVHQDGV